MIDLNDIDERISKLQKLRKDAKRQGNSRATEFYTDLINAYKEIRDKDLGLWGVEEYL